MTTSTEQVATVISVAKQHTMKKKQNAIERKAKKQQQQQHSSDKFEYKTAMALNKNIALAIETSRFIIRELLPYNINYSYANLASMCDK